MCPPLIRHVNISLEICPNVFGSLMGPYKDPIWIRIWILYGFLCGSYMGCLYVAVFTTDPKCEYFIANMRKCVRGSLLGASWIPIRIPHRSLYGSHMDPYVDLIWVVYL